MWNVVRELPKGKALGHDNIPSKQLIGEDMLNFVKEFLISSVMLKNFNISTMVLLPK
jgi:hypothetical protein